MSELLNSIFSNANANPTSDGQCSGCVSCCTGCRIPNGIPAKLADGTPDFRNLVTKPERMTCWWLNTQGPPDMWGCGIYEQRPLACRAYRCWALTLLDQRKTDLLVQIYDVLREHGVDGRKQVYRSLSNEADRVK